MQNVIIFEDDPGDLDKIVKSFEYFDDHFEELVPEEMRDDARFLDQLNIVYNPISLERLFTIPYKGLLDAAGVSWTAFMMLPLHALEDKDRILKYYEPGSRTGTGQHYWINRPRPRYGSLQEAVDSFRSIKIAQRFRDEGFFGKMFLSVPYITDGRFNLVYSVEGKGRIPGTDNVFDILHNDSSYIDVFSHRLPIESKALDLRHALYSIPSIEVSVMSLEGPDPETQNNIATPYQAA